MTPRLLRSFQDTLYIRPRVLPELHPLFDHLIQLARSSYNHGNAKRAGRELLAARRLLRHGDRAKGNL